jgi:hypothetical protein
LKKKKVANNVVLIALFVIFFLKTHKGSGRRFFFPFFKAPVSLSFRNPKITNMTHTPFMASIKMKKQRGQISWMALGRVAGGTKDGEVNGFDC